VASTPLAAKWLQDQKVVLREKWRVSRAQVEKFKADHGLSYLSGEKLRDLQVDRLNEQKVLAGTKTEETRARVEQVRRMLKSRDYQQLANTNNSEVLTKLRDRLAAASQREASLNTTLLPNHPSLRKARAEIASLRKQIENEGRRVLDDLEVKFRSAQEREQLIGQNFDKTISDMQESGTSIVKLRELERTAASDRKIYESFLNRSNETIEQSTGSFANFRLIKSAQVPIKPSFPGKLKVLVLAAMGSLALGIGLSLVQEALNSTFRPQDQISDSLGLPLLASLPTRLNGDAAQGLPSESFISRESGTPLANAVKRLLRAMGPAGGAALPTGMIAVTSTGEGEGKTMTAVSLAQMAALSGSKVLLIDGDIRNPSLDRIFSHESWNCIARDHHDSVGSNPMLFEDRSTGLHILPAFGGQARGNGSVDSHEFKEMLLTAREEYELVIVDTAGVLTNPDSWDLADAADQVIFVIASNKTQHESASRALEMLKTCHARMAGVVLNFADNEQMAERKGNAPAFSSAARHGIHGFALRAGRAETGQQRPYPLG
jgi:Mrp family chromosome partitioning ATPase